MEHSGEELRAAYARCRQLHREHGRTYYLATRLLPRWKRRHVHALYGFTRFADEIVDSMPDATVAEREKALTSWADTFTAGLTGEPVDDPLLPAVLDTIDTFGLDLEDFRKFLLSMTMDLTVTGYASYDDLLGYMEGSAAVIGTMMLPILQTRPGVDLAQAREPARQLGNAFQLTNFIRDVAEDLDRGRVYLPQEDLDRFGVSRADLRAAAAAGRSTPAVRELVRYEVDRAREHYRAAAPGVLMLSPASQACIRTAYVLYGGILDEVVAAGYDVLGGRVSVPNRRRLAVAGRSLLSRPGRVVVPPGAPLAAAAAPARAA